MRPMQPGAGFLAVDRAKLLSLPRTFRQLRSAGPGTAEAKEKVKSIIA